MKKILTAAIIAATAALISSCAKENPAVTGRKMVPATIHAEASDMGKVSASRYYNEDEKAYMYQIDWVSGDELAVFTDKSVSPYRFTTTDEGRKATFTGEIPEGENVRFSILPFDEEATAAVGSDKVLTTIPSYQNGSFNNILIASTEVRESDNSYASHFQAISGIVKFNIPETMRDSLVYVEIISKYPISGSVEVDFSGETPVVRPHPNVQASDIFNTVTVANPDGTPLEPGDYYAAVFPITKELNGIENLSLTLRFFSKNFHKAYHACKLGDGAGHDIFVPNVVKSLGTVGNIEFVDARGGLFTAGADGHKIRFAQGNLQYRASDGIWRFAEDSWDAQGDIGNATRPVNNKDEGERATQDEWIDLFQWGHSGWTITPRDKGITFQPYSSSNSNDVVCAAVLEAYGGIKPLTGAYKEGDFGVHNPISNGGNVKGLWRLPTSAEIDYILKLTGGAARTVNKIEGGSGSSAYSLNLYYLRCGVEVADMVRYGVLLFPDGFKWPDGLIDRPLLKGWPYCSVSYATIAHKDCPVYSLPDFSVFEKLGCIFLPCAGYLEAYGYDHPEQFSTNQKVSGYDISRFNNFGYYHTSDEANRSTHLAFYSQNISVLAIANTRLVSARLVMDVNTLSDLEEYNYNGAEIK